MNWLAEIKEKYKSGNVIPFQSIHERVGEQTSDINYLLSLLKITEKALEDIVNRTGNDAQYAIDEAEEALQKIRS